MYIALLLTILTGSAAICHIVAKKRGIKAVFWGVMGIVFGPFAIPFVFLVKPGTPS